MLSRNCFLIRPRNVKSFVPEDVAGRQSALLFSRRKNSLRANVFSMPRRHKIKFNDFGLR